MLITLAEIEAAQHRIAGVAVRTPLLRLDPDRLRAAGFTPPPFELFLKVESAQPIGSFKLRGAYNMAAQLTPAQRVPGLITYSSGNHAQGVAFAARALGVPAIIVMPSNAPEVKKRATAGLGAELVFVGPSSSERKDRAEALAAQHGYAIIPPYDDARIIAGQATCGLEIVQQLAAAGLPPADLVLAPVSGGGLLSGVAAAIKLATAAGLSGTVPADAEGASSATQIWGAEPELAADAKESFDTGRLVEWSAAQTSRTLSDGLRTQSLGVLNFEHIRHFVDAITTVAEDQILDALRASLAATDLAVEPSGAVTLAAALFTPLPPARLVVAVLSGGNIDPALRTSLLPT